MLFCKYNNKRTRYLRTRYLPARYLPKRYAQTHRCRLKDAKHSPYEQIMTP